MKTRKVKLGEVVVNADGTRTYRVLVGRTQHGRVTVGSSDVHNGTCFLTQDEQNDALALAVAAFKAGR